MKGAQHTPCAACRHQRRKCDPDCAMARYFPADRAREFADVHRVFGVSNLVRLHKAAVAAMICEAAMRRTDPVHGCLGVVRSLHDQIAAVAAEIDATRRQIGLHRVAAGLLSPPPPVLTDLEDKKDEESKPSVRAGSESCWPLKRHCSVEDRVDTLDSVKRPAEEVAKWEWEESAV